VKVNGGRSDRCQCQLQKQKKGGRSRVVISLHVRAGQPKTGSQPDQHDPDVEWCEKAERTNDGGIHRGRPGVGKERMIGDEAKRDKRY
jgi:hypothetical protein